MDATDDRLKALFADDEPPARDAVFSTAVIETLVRRQFRQDVLLLSGATLVGSTGLWAVWPSLQPALVAISQGLMPVVAILALVAATAATVNRRPGAVLGAGL